MSDPQRPTIIFAHGLWMKGLEMTWLRSRLRESVPVALIGHSHTTMLFAQDVVEQCDYFLRNGAFRCASV